MPDEPSTAGGLTFEDIIATYRRFSRRQRSYVAGVVAYGHLTTAWDKAAPPVPEHEPPMLVPEHSCPIECDPNLPQTMVKVLDGHGTLVEVWTLDANGRWIVANMERLRHFCQVDLYDWMQIIKEAKDA